MKFHARPHPGPTAVELSEMDTSGRSRSVRRRRLPAPTGLRLKAQGCRAAATLGILATERSNPNGVEPRKAQPTPQPLWGCSSLNAPTQGSPAARANPGLEDAAPLGHNWRVFLNSTAVGPGRGRASMTPEQ